MSEVGVTRSLEDYEDDFEKDLDWLISEEERSAGQGSDFYAIETEIDKELAEDEKHQKLKKRKEKVVKRGRKGEENGDDEYRWPPPMEPLEYDSDSDSPRKLSSLVPPPPGMEEPTEEERKYIQEKIQRANRELQDQEAPDLSRRRRLHFKETLVTMVVPPGELEKVGEAEMDEEATQAEVEVSGKMSELQLSPGEQRAEGQKGMKEGKVLVEKDGKFDLVSLKEVESQGLLPRLPDSSQETPGPRRTHRVSSSPCSGASPLQHGSAQTSMMPRPPAQPRHRPSSANHSPRVGPRRSAGRRVQSASGTPFQATYTLTPQQKELLLKIRERKEKQAREAEQRKREEEEQKKQENELAFKAWLLRKRGQLQEEKRIHRAREMERINSKRESSDPEEAFRSWLQRKQEQQQREKQLVELRRQEEDSGYLLRSREECERAFKVWLTRKRAEKRAEQQAARERSRKLVLEERRARRMRDLMCSVSDSTPFRFTESFNYRF
ncbi:coiled-coil domain-containing protein 181 isoform X2 [Synchiropus splendidus]|nr:coiled-coil domain-containing protein 181 isoform X2 [Synchiropus splendidus]